MSATLTNDELLITRTFDAPAALLFALWTDPQHFKNWMGPGSFECRAIEMDVRVGGAYRGMIHSAESGESWFGGTYRELEPNKRIVFTWTWDSGPSGDVESLVTITFDERNDRTTQLFHQTKFLSAERRDSHVGGWTKCFDKLGGYAEKITRETAQ